jgi:hypothetical protein
MRARTMFRKRFMSSEVTKSPIRIRRENINLAWVCQFRLIWICFDPMDEVLEQMESGFLLAVPL